MVGYRAFIFNRGTQDSPAMIALWTIIEMELLKGDPMKTDLVSLL
ncbi:hypothetical protein CES86_3858 [Brucella lupini]|uniref:Uncharacterized protein n=1 Tax=Brucella lupini TaxID=255457 RepID=A0A256GHH9_9HYPH|nr:hypothetical protein CES86_3858 [Brucella lupini]